MNNVNINLRTRTNTEKTNKILPNLNAVKRNNVPLKGLAFKEVKQIINKKESVNNEFNSRSIDSFRSQQSLNYYRPLPPLSLPQAIYTDNKCRMNQRQIFQAIHRGLASSSNKLSIAKINIKMASLKSNPSLASFQ